MKLIYHNIDTKERLDHFLVSTLNCSRSKVTVLIKTNSILVNGVSVKPGFILSINDEIEIIDDNKETEPNEIPAIAYPLDILYEDEYLMVINKPNNVLVHPTTYNEEQTLASYIKYYFLSKGIKFNQDDLRWGICHRLDKDTTGCLLVAKDCDIQEKLQREIQNKNVKREYIGLVKGNLESKKMKIDVPMKRGTKGSLYMETSTDHDAKEAITYLDALEEYSNFSKIKFRLETGRTHQIRVHCKYINHPIINDPMYSNESPFSKFNQYLHASKIAFIHPITNKYVEVESKLPQEFEEYIAKNKDM